MVEIDKCYNQYVCRSKHLGQKHKAYQRALTLVNRSLCSSQIQYIQYNHLLCLSEIGPSHEQQKTDEDTRQRHPASSSRKDDKDKEINDDYDVGAWWAEWEGGWGGVEKRFVFNINVCTAKTTGIFRWSGSIFCRLNPERIISSFLLFDKAWNRGRYSDILLKRISLSCWYKKQSRK